MMIMLQYKKNLWITVGAMCASLATSAFFMFLMEHNRLHPVIKKTIRVIDLIAFLMLPLLLVARRFIAININMYLDMGLRAANRMVDGNEFINRLKCSINPRENVSVCIY